jgi:hypothetical protein
MDIALVCHLRVLRDRCSSHTAPLGNELIHVLREPVGRGTMTYRNIYVAGLARMKHE